MTFTNVKTLLFASLIVAMVLPFSSIQIAQAEISFEEKQQRLIDKVIRLDERIANNPGDQVKIDRLEAKKQVLLERLFNNVHAENDDIKEATTVNTQRHAPNPRSYNNPTTPNYNIFINGVHNGCDNANETWNFKGAATNGSSRLSIVQSFPSELTTGSAPYCASWDWENNVYLQLRNVFNSDEGCHANLITNPSTSYSLNCQTPISGLWIVEVTADYEFHQVTGYTYVVLF